MHSPTQPTTAGIEQVQREAFSRLFRQVTRVLTVLSPLPVVMGSLGLIGDTAVWRRWCVALALALVVVGLGVVTAWRRQPVVTHESGRMLPLVAFPLFTVVNLSLGGLESPLIPLVLPVSLATAILFTPARARRWAGYLLALVGVQAAVTLTGTVEDLVPPLFGGGPRAGHNTALLLTMLAVTGFLVLWTNFVGTNLRRTFRGMVRTALDARDEALNAHEERVRSLTTLSGEIAHELKNPLASVKGLAAMIAREVEGRPAERLAVLRREVDRMQEILEGFLNFSRPLLPLNEAHVPLDGLCRQVAELHEGMAGERGVGLRVAEGPPVEAWCDARKVRQVLIDVVQNALDAAPRGTTVELQAWTSREGGGRVEVRDRGPGLADEVRERVFEPGITTKPHGSGLGLALSRALMRQHGGELNLRAREGGGCVAELSLPAAQSPRKEALP
ncbi:MULTISPECIES: sensor histidine kinase [unclassified Corallococcus]|uniref:sensor histidine kinase n=1 Tax=unclassified Corallococcus TaxID=2685029 RepID=UPI001A8F8F5B|nr:MULTISPECIES: HAMP domain-containing sensor histidine kinase [unclassified Corallococcus]MBN9683476.1 HAMP domain-containing histidine kinase [Corallococcus sp. NCSPR001]WAS85007.1 HAMP domain-containing sensor histidine kinase [Corallococcus sp. NCRR]